MARMALGRFALLSLPLAVLTACGAAPGDNGDASAQTALPAQNASVVKAAADCPDAPRAIKRSDFVGLTLEAAAARATDQGLRARVAEIDGKCQPGSYDFSRKRVNFHVTDGTVVTAAIY